MSKAQSSGHRPDSDGKKTSALAPVAVSMWALSAAAAAALLYLVTPDGAIILGSLDVALPLVTELALSTGTFLHESTGLLVFAGALLVTLLPYLLGARGNTATKAYFAMAMFGLLVTAASWYALSHPIDLLARQLDLPAMPFGK